MAKRKSSSGFSSNRKRLIWFLAVTLVIVIIIVYETNQELGRQTDPPSATQTADSASISIEKAQSEVRSYYRSHEFPAGWKVGDTDLIAPDRLEVSLFFSPSIGTSRHGKAARSGEITAANTCPEDAALRQRIERFSLWIRVNDKTGLIDSFSC